MDKYTDEELFKILRDDEKMEDFFNKLDEEGLKKFLIYTHSRALNIPFEEDEFEKQDMVCGAAFGGTLGLVSPSNEIQEKSIQNISVALKNIKGRENIALLLHYLVNQLHLFSDGNGRTGRCMLDLFLNDEFDFDKSDICKHSDDSYDIAKISTAQLEKNYGVKSVEKAMGYTSYMIFRSLLENGMISNELNTSDCCFTLLHREGKEPIYINEDIKDNLSAEQNYKINTALTDSSASPFESGALALLVMKKKLSQTYNFNPELISVAFDVNDKNTFNGWKKEDYLLTKEIYDRIKAMSVDMMLDIFEKPENFKMNENTTMSECFLKDLNRENPRIGRQIRQLWENSKINLDGTRTKQHLDELVQFLGQEHTLDNTEEVISVLNLGKQTLEQQKDSLGKQDLENMETELIQHESNLNQIQNKEI